MQAPLPSALATSLHELLRSPDQPSADLKTLVVQWVAAHLGIRGIIALAVFFAAASIWWNWDKIRKLPGIASVLDRKAARQAAESARLAAEHPQPLPPLPTPTPGRFAVVVAHLENDRDAEQERLVIEAVSEYGGIQTLRFDRTIAPKNDIIEEAIKAGHEQARQLLAESHADVLIWGTVLRSGEKTIPKLHWTTPRKLPSEDRARRYQLTEELELPQLFLSDLTDLLDLLVLTSQDYMALSEAYTRGPLPAFIERVDHLLTTQSPTWPQPTRSSLMFAFGDLCLVHGTINWKQDEWLRKSQAAYEAGLPKPEDDWIPRGYVNALFNYAQTHFRRGICLPDRDQLEKAVPLYSAVAVYCSDGRDPWLYTYTNMELGHTLSELAEQETGTARLNQALTAYSSALDEVDQTRQPDWYRVLIFARAKTLLLIGKQEPGTSHLEDAIPAFEGVIKLCDSTNPNLRQQAETLLAETRKELQSRTATP